MKFTFNLSLIAVALCFLSCNQKLKSVGDQNIQVFQDEQISWGHPEATDSITANKDGIIRLTGGRIILKKISIPHFEKNTTAKVHVSLVSNGDPWDKSGSCFILPKESAINLLSIQKKENQFPDFKIGEENFPGIVQAANYIPTLELMRFMTPFGVGHFSDHPRTKEIKPVYIPEWEKEVRWEQDVSDRLSELEGEIWVGVWIDSWTKEGYKVSVNLEFDESDVPNHKAKKTWTSPIVNTINFFGPMNFADFFSRNDLTSSFTLPKNVTNVRLNYIVTGHGGHEGGDEFVKKEHIISVDKEKVFSFIPWRNDCASFRRFNPSSGVWTEKTTWKGKEIDERVASSDYSRSNWCPGTDISPVEIELYGLMVGEHTFTISIPEAQELKENELNHWLISAYLTGDIVE